MPSADEADNANGEEDNPQQEWPEWFPTVLPAAVGIGRTDVSNGREIQPDGQQHMGARGVQLISVPHA